MKKSGESETGWWIVGLLEKHSDSDRPPYWNNYRLIKAEDWRTAFRKGTELGEADAKAGNEAFSARHEFIGVSDLVPIYDELGDGAELLWQELEASEDNDGIPLKVFTESDLESQYEQAANQGRQATASPSPATGR